KNLKVEPAQDTEGEDLEDRVDGHQYRGGFAVAAGQVVPDEDHGDAAGEPDDDQPGAVFGQVGQEDPSEDEHESRGQHPVDHQRGDHEFLVLQDGSGFVVADLGQDRIHHHQQPEGDGQ